MILPVKEFKGKSPGEDIFWEKCSEYLPTEYVSFHNYYIAEIHQADIIILVPSYGILIIENKSYKAKNIMHVPDRTMIIKKHGIPEMSPFEQVMNYRDILTGQLSAKDDELKKIYVAGAVGYPYISEEEFENKSLNKISPRRFTFLKEDLENTDRFNDKINDIFTYLYEEISFPQLDKYSLDAENLNKVGNLICPNFRQIVPETIEDTVYDEVFIQRTEYSELHYFDVNETIESIDIERLMRLWRAGTKLWLYFESKELHIFVLEKFNKLRRSLGIEGRKAFGENSSSVFFCFTSDWLDLESETFHIVNGVDYIERHTLLKELNRKCNFNIDQFILEHSELSDLIVKAGAGTGKTYSLVSRINYLCWKRGYTSDELVESVLMITFTNDSADSMKEKLIDNFSNFFILTKNPMYLEYMDAAENMNISTIHSLSKRIVGKFGSKLGMGSNIKITSGSYDKGRILHEKLNECVISNPEIFRTLSISIYQLEKKLLNLMGKFDNKNIDLAEEIEKIDFGAIEPSNLSFIVEVMSNTKKEIEVRTRENNSILLGSLITTLKSLASDLDISDFGKRNVEFVFVDEFQDTDDVQIELLSKFKEILGYKLFVVGDIKQCIYRFRGADEEAFDKLVEFLGHDITELSLQKNYRTDIRLMDRMNSVFSKWDEAGDISYSGDNVLIGTLEQEDSPDYIKKESSKESFENDLVSVVNECTEESVISDKGIAILVRYNWQVDLVKDICEQNQISIETTAGGNLYKLEPTIDLLKLLKALKHHDNPEYLFSLYTTAYANKYINKLMVREIEQKKLKTYFIENLPDSLKKWKEYIGEVHRQPLLKVLRDIIDDVEPWDIFATRIGGNREEINRNRKYYLVNLDQLFEKIVHLFSGDYLTLNRLIDFLELMIVTRQEEDEREVFNIPDESENKLICTTIHKAKGLEYDTVILPYCDFDIESKRSKGDVDLFYIDDNSKHKVGFRIIDNNRSTIVSNKFYHDYKINEYSDRAKEETRILYVAMTRAIRKLIYFSEGNRNTRGKRWSSMMEVNDESNNI